MAFYGNFEIDFTIGKEAPKTGRSARVRKNGRFLPAPYFVVSALIFQQFPKQIRPEVTHGGIHR
jgi:hypothetical protein